MFNFFHVNAYDPIDKQVILKARVALNEWLKLEKAKAEFEFNHAESDIMREFSKAYAEEIEKYSKIIEEIRRKDLFKES